jgi:hypothetical protein
MAHRTWYNPQFPNGISSRSPIKLGNSKPYWALAADEVLEVNGSWGAKDPTVDPGGTLPPHRRIHGPAGGNELFCDGSVQWYEYE